MDLATFRTYHPEFQQVPDTLIQGELTAALLEINTGLWGDLTDQGQRLLTAHKLALSPYGIGTRLVAKDGSTTYWTHYRRLVEQIGGGGMVL